MSEEKRTRYDAVILARVPGEAARRIRELAAADDRPAAALARRWILEGLERAQERSSKAPAGA
jgi:hypothetical protein